MGTSPTSRDTTTSNKRGRQVKVGKGFVRKTFLNTDMVASWIVSGSCLLILGLSSLSTLTHASPISAEHHSGLFDPKRSGSRGFHEGIFDEGFGGFSTLRKRGKRSDFQKRRPEMTSRGIHGDAFTGGFGDFYTMKRSGMGHHPNLDEWTLAKLLDILETEESNPKRYSYYN